MDQDSILAKLTSIFRTVFDDDGIVLSRASNSDDIEEWDSLNQIRIILACEGEFGLQLDARRINAFENVGDMVDYLGAELARR